MRKLTYIFLLFSQFIFSQHISLERDTILIGDQIKFTVNHILNSDNIINWPSFNDRIVDGIEIIKKTEIDTMYRDSNGIAVIQQQYIVTSFDSGTYIIPPIFFTEDIKSKELNLVVNTISVDDSLIENTTPLIGIKEDLSPDELEDFNKKRRKIIIIILVILILLIVLAYLIYKYLQKKEIIKPKVIVPIHVSSLNKLQKLKKQELWQKGELKEYYSKISIIIREYIELRFRFNALELPTFNILLELKKLKVEKDIIEALEIILKRSDNIKYAKGLSLEKENKEVMSLSVNFIKKTKIENDRVSK